MGSPFLTSFLWPSFIPHSSRHLDEMSKIGTLSACIPCMVKEEREALPEGDLDLNLTA